MQYMTSTGKFHTWDAGALFDPKFHGMLKGEYNDYWTYSPSIALNAINGSAYFRRVCCVDVDPAVMAVIKKQLARATRKQVLADIVQPPNGKQYQPHQIRNQKWVTARRASIVADAPGLGKTITAAAVINSEKPVCVIYITLGYIRLSTQRELMSWCHRQDIKVVSNGGVVDKTGVNIMSYETMVNLETQLLKLSGKDNILWIFDEFHAIKNPNSQRGRLAYRLILNGYKVVAMSGTPFVNSMMEMAHLLNAMDPVNFNGFPNESTTLPKLKEKLYKTLMISNDRKDAWSDAPECTTVIRVVDPGTGKEKRFDSWDSVPLNRSAKFDFQSMATDSMLNGLQKISYAAKAIQDILTTTEKVVVFAEHTDVINELYSVFKRAGHGVSVLKGGMSQKAKQNAIDTFQHGDHNIFIGSTKAASCGITLTAAAHAFVVEAPFTMADIDQMSNRIYRIGQKKAVTVEHLILQGTIDEAYVRVLKSKHKLVKGIGL